MKLQYALLIALFCAVAGASTSFGQAICSDTVRSSKLVCVIPQLYGPGGLSDVGPNAALEERFNHEAHFGASFVSEFTPLNSNVASQLAQLPLASPSSGITFTFDPTTGAFAPSSDISFGPILGERAETIGRHRLYAAFSYQYFGFNSIDGLNLKGLPAVFTHAPAMLFGSNPPRTCTVDGDNLTGCGYERDVIVTNNRINLSANQYTTYLTFGLLRRVDVSVAIPIVSVRMKVTAAAQIIPNSDNQPTPTSAQNLHLFRPRTDCPAPCLSSSFTNERSASGIGDVIFRVKANVWKGERAGVALGVDVRAPTGDELNFLGSGAAGFKPFGVFSYQARFSPHVTLGYQWNGDSVLAGNLTTGTKAQLPGQFLYSGGVDIAVSKALSVALDLLGQRVIDGSRVVATTFTDLGPCVPNVPSDPTNPNTYCTSAGPRHTFANITQTSNSYSINNGSAGLKFSPVRNRRFLVTTNVFFRLDDGGLRAKVVPLIGASYTF
jgi:Putative MetA-pathway of phenol degradation